jgi:hypothetical protein
MSRALSNVFEEMKRNCIAVATSTNTRKKKADERR